MIDIEKLKALAEAATQGGWSHWRHGVIKGGPVVEFSNGSSQQQIAMTTGAEWMRDGEQAANADFIAAANPSAVLELIAEVQTLGSYLCTCPNCGGEGEIFSGGYSYFGHMDPPEPNMDRCGECDGKGLIVTPQDLHSVIAERDQLKAENEDGLAVIRTQKEQLECYIKDAERYRWIRDNNVIRKDVVVTDTKGTLVWHWLDDEVDQAIAKAADHD